VASKTADLIEKHGFPNDKRLGAGVVDGRSVWADGDTPSAFIAALQAKVSSTFHSPWL
jgi:5-methyltetrahydropteroyltriglutamate--homocysteine methyltransferase